MISHRANAPCAFARALNQSKAALVLAVRERELTLVPRWESQLVPLPVEQPASGLRELWCAAHAQAMGGQPQCSRVQPASATCSLMHRQPGNTKSRGVFGAEAAAGLVASVAVRQVPAADCNQYRRDTDRSLVVLGAKPVRPAAPAASTPARFGAHTPPVGQASGALG